MEETEMETVIYKERTTDVAREVLKEQLQKLDFDMNINEYVFFNNLVGYGEIVIEEYETPDDDVLRLIIDTRDINALLKILEFFKGFSVIKNTEEQYINTNGSLSGDTLCKIESYTIICTTESKKIIEYVIY
jgi:hypothetical protein